MAVRKCSKCERDFMCISEKGGCWCENLNLSDETLKMLSDCFENCLCPECLSTYTTPALKREGYIEDARLSVPKK